MQTAQRAGIRTLYHYEPFCPKYFEDILVNKRVHVSNISNVNDPWDCRPLFDKNVSDPNRRRAWSEFFKPMLEHRTDEQKEAMAKMNPPWTDDQPFLYRTIDYVTANAIANNINLWRMYCLSPRPHSTLMWAHYALKHAGICLEFDVSENKFGRAGKVQYLKTLPLIGPELLGNPDALTDAVLLTKSEDWDYEEEYRLLCRDEKSDPTFQLTCKDEFLPLPDGALTGVIVGEKCPGAHAQTIRDMIAAHAPHAEMTSR